MNVGTVADISGDNAKHQISSTSLKARWVCWSVTGSGAARVGDTNVSSSRGAAVTASAQAVTWGPDADQWQQYDLSQLYAYVPTGATLTITYGGVG